MKRVNDIPLSTRIAVDTVLSCVRVSNVTLGPMDTDRMREASFQLKALGFDWFDVADYLEQHWGVRI